MAVRNIRGAVPRRVNHWPDPRRQAHVLGKFSAIAMRGFSGYHPEVSGSDRHQGALMRRSPATSDVDTRRQRVVLDELPARLDEVAHQLVEKHIGLVDFLDA